MVNSFKTYALILRESHVKQLTFTCSQSTIKTLERCQLRRSGVFIVGFEHSHLFLVFLLLTLNKFSGNYLTGFYTMGILTENGSKTRYKTLR